MQMVVPTTTQLGPNPEYIERRCTNTHVYKYT